MPRASVHYANRSRFREPHSIAITPSSTSKTPRETKKWVKRWKYEMTDLPVRPGIWELRGGGYFLRTRMTDPRSGKVHEIQRALRNATLSEAVTARTRLASDAQNLVSGRKQPPKLLSEYAEQLLLGKISDGTIESAKNRSHWIDSLARIFEGGLGDLYVDEVTYADLVAWRDKAARWMRGGMPSNRKRDQGKGKLVHLAAATANGCPTS
jgi:hypothetical protein